MTRAGAPSTEPRAHQGRLLERLGSVDRITRLGLAAIAATATGLYFWAYFHHPARPRSPEELGWAVWFDQSWYYKAALAWSKGNLDPSQHLYLPGYALSGAAFVPVLPLHPFLLPDLIFLLAALWLFSNLTARLAPELPFAKLAGAAIFFVCSVLSSMFEQWVVPISTSGSTPFVYGCLLAAVLFVTTPINAKWPFLAALAAGGVVFFRPTDVLPLAAAAGAGMAISLLLRWPGWRTSAWIVSAALAGGAISLGLLLAIYLALYGFRESHYLRVAGQFGFGWQQIPLQWVTLFLDPRPWLPEGEGMIHRYPFIVAGISGFVATLSFPGSRSRLTADGVVVGAVVLHIILYCAFRDLHPGGLFRFGNYHYFKWILPVIGLYSVRFVWALVVGPHRLATAAVGIAPLLLLLPWRAELRPVSSPNAPTIKGNTVFFNADLTDMRNTILVPTLSDWDAAYTHSNTLKMAGKTWSRQDVRLFAQPGGSMLALLRPIAKGEGEFTPQTVPMRSGAQAVYARRHFVLGVPCFVLPERAACQPSELLEPATYDTNTVSELQFGGMELPYLSVGWSFTQADGRWTDGKLVSMRFRLPELRANVPLLLELQAVPFVPPGSDPIRIRMIVNGRQLNAWVFADQSATTLRVTIPPDLVGADKKLDVSMRVDNPRSPRQLSFDTHDQRLLGLFVQKVRLKPADAGP